METTNTTNKENLHLITINNQPPPEQQALVIQNTDPVQPIQLRVDPVTDYNALWFTIGASILVSAITAFVTIFLITRSNNSLINNQNNQQEKLIDNQNTQQKKELSSRYRQEWINDTRILISDYINNAEQHSGILITYINLRITISKQAKISNEKMEEYNSAAKELSNNLLNLRAKSNLIDLTLSKEDEIDREIYTLTNSIIVDYEKITSDLINKIYDGEIFKYIYLEDISKFDEIIRINSSIDTIKNKTKELLKSEWERVKKFDL